LFWLKRYRSKPIMSILAILSLFLIAANSSFAAPVQQFSYRTQISQDLDGDQKPETATVRQAGQLYQVSVHFSTGRPKIHLTTHLRQGLAGLSRYPEKAGPDRRIVSLCQCRLPAALSFWLHHKPDFLVQPVAPAKNIHVKRLVPRAGRQGFASDRHPVTSGSARGSAIVATRSSDLKGIKRGSYEV